MIPTRGSDNAWMQQAFELAKKGLYTTRPNPVVGCVLVKEGECIGQGYHKRAGEGHAEANALIQAGFHAKGATCYVTLEPCSHYGRTPPCADALIKAGIKRVVVACTDPNPEVSGRGIAKLKQAGIDVVVGVMEDEALKFNQGFFKHIREQKPFVRVKLACSLDGKIALANGVSKWVTSPESRADVQSWRARSGAIVTSAQTVIQDNARLNIRYEEWSAYQDVPIEADEVLAPLRVVVDTQARMHPELAIFSTTTPILLVSAVDYAQEFPTHVSCITLPKKDGHICLDHLLMYLGAQQIQEVMVEAGATLAGAFWQQGLCDELLLYQAPKVLGAKAQDLLQIPSLTTMEDLQTLMCLERKQLGSDMRFRFALIQSPHR